jgi:hypothetical protein
VADTRRAYPSLAAIRWVDHDRAAELAREAIARAETLQIMPTVIPNTVQQLAR